MNTFRHCLTSLLAHNSDTVSNRKTVPQVFINNHHIGGGVDFHEVLQSGSLDELLSA